MTRFHTSMMALILLISTASACLPIDLDNPEGDIDGDSSQPLETSYHYVLITDEEDPDLSSPTHTAGIDLFGAQLDKNGTIYNASEVHGCGFGTGDNGRATDCNQIIGVPDDTCSPTDSYPSYVSLGGAGGFMIVSFGALEEIRTGDQIHIYECGSEHNRGATDERYDFFVGVGTDPDDSTWVECMRGATGEASCTVPYLPSVEID